jgi:carbamoyltransferase
VGYVRKEKRKPIDIQEESCVGFEKLKVTRSVVPAITHVDFSSRLHTVDIERNPLYYRVVKKFNEKYSCPVIINTSFNVRGEPIVCTPEHAYRCFMATDLDCLFMEGYLVDKKDQKGKINLKEYLKDYELD